MWPDRVSNPRPLTYESGALSIALPGLAGQQNTYRKESTLYGKNLLQEEQILPLKSWLPVRRAIKSEKGRIYPFYLKIWTVRFFL